MTGARSVWRPAVTAAAGAVAVTAGLAATALVAGLARADGPPAAVAVPVVVAAAAAGAAVAGVLLRRGWTATAVFGLLWMVATLAHHVFGGLVPCWADRPLTGAAHVVWDAAYHGPSVVVAAVTVAAGRP